MIPADYLSTVTLTAGCHEPGGAVCAMEALACALGLAHSDAPACTDAPLATAFRRVNDWSGWRRDEERTAFLRPYLGRLGRLALAARHAPDAAYAYAAADVASRVIAPLALSAAGRDDAATTLRALSPVVDRATARAAAAADAAFAAAYAADAADADYAAYAAYAADAAERAAAAADYAERAAAFAADAAFAAAADYAERAAAYAAAADYAERAAAYAADAAFAAAAADYAERAAAYADAAGALLTCLLDVCESGCWPIPVVGVTS